MKKKLYRSNDVVVFGVCSGMGEALDLNPWGVRLLWVLVTLMAGPLTLIAYVTMALILEKRPTPPPIPASFSGFSCASRSETLGLLMRRFERLESRLQRMESVVTRPSFGLEKEYRDL